MSAEAIAAADTVVEVVANPTNTPLDRHARTAGKRLISGAEVMPLHAAEQFVRYTGIRPSDDQLQRAAAFSRAV